MDSAADVAVTARDDRNQGIYGIKKPKNIFDANSDVESHIVGVFNNIMTICGLEPGKKCDPSKSEVARILMLTDGDIDGDLIAISTISLLAKHCKPLIDAGMVGRIVPPAYSFPEGKKRVFVRSKREFYKKLSKNFIKGRTLSYKGRELSKSEFSDFIEKNFEYNSHLDKLADRYTCDPKFMEYIASKYHGNLSDQKISYWKSMLKAYPDLTVTIENGHILIDGTIGMESYNVPMDEYFHGRVMKFKKFQDINNSIVGYELDGVKMSIYEIMHKFDICMPKGVKRYKGLGELDPQEMKELCMDRDKRTVVIFKFENFEEDMEKLNIVMSSSAKYSRLRKEMMQAVVLEDVDLDT